MEFIKLKDVRMCPNGFDNLNKIVLQYFFSTLYVLKVKVKMNFGPVKINAKVYKQLVQRECSLKVSKTTVNYEFFGT